MNKATVVTVLAAAVLMLGGCGGSKEPAGEAASSAPAAGAPIDGCTETATEELYVRKLYHCDARQANVYTFDSKEARDNWWKVAESTGSMKNTEGDTWMEVKQ